MSVATAKASPSLPDAEFDDQPAVEFREDFNAPGICALIVLSLIPFWLVPASHVLSSPETATGFFHYELPYYVANGRAAFERGNGVMYPNPYDPSADSPSIYVHWLPWTLGLMTTQPGCDPGDVTLVVTFFASLAFAWATFQLVAYRVNSQRNQRTAFLLAMWGGGCLAIAGTAVGLWNGTPWLESALQFDPGNGLWFLNWGRNALFPTEAIYHSLVVFCWLAELRRKSTTANIWLLLLATTHPWSGLELLLTINLWRFVQFVRSVVTRRPAPLVPGEARNPADEKANQELLDSVALAAQQADVPQFASARNQLSISVAALIVFLGYYKVWLPSFAQHAELQGVWELNWSVTYTAAFLAYSLVAGFAVAAVSRLRQWSTTEQFLLCALAVATGLAFHDRLIKPVQPIHFTRGYVWMPLFLLGLPTILQWLSDRRTSASKLSWAAMALLFCFVLDNAVFAIVHSNRQYRQLDSFHLDRNERTLCSALHANELTRGQIVLSDSEDLNYLLPTFADVRPWLGHHFNTPDFPNRKARWQQCFESNHVHIPSIPPDVNVLITRHTRRQSELVDHPDWKPVRIQNTEWHVWRR